MLINGPDLTRELQEPVIVIPTDSDAQRPYEMPFVARSTPKTEPPVTY
jgi:hypothetical protein